MDKFDVRGAKLLAIIGLILFIFIMVIANAYQYLPTDNSDIPDVNSEINQPIDNANEDNYNVETDNEENNDSEETNYNQSHENDGETVSNNEYTPLENIDNEDNSGNSENNFAECINNAKQLKDEKKLVKAVEEYQKALNLAENSKQKAECYEEISTIYAVTKKYGTALSYAQKAYNLSPSTSREILLARLYYKTGSTDKASDRINNVLRRDFNQDN